MKKLSIFFLILFFAGLLVYLRVNSPFKVTAVKEDAGSVTFSYSLVNINTAGAEEMDSLPFIGKKTANNIIEYREKYGKFTKIEEIKKVKGIGEKTFLKLKERISAE